VFCCLLLSSKTHFYNAICRNESEAVSSAVSDQTPPPRQTPLGHNPLVFCRSWVGWGQDPNCGSDRVRSTCSVSFQQKYLSGSVLRCPTAAENRVVTKGVVSGGFDLRLQYITSSPPQTLRRRVVRTTDDGRRRKCSARRLLPFVADLFFTLRDSYG